MNDSFRAMKKWGIHINAVTLIYPWFLIVCVVGHVRLHAKLLILGRSQPANSVIRADQRARRESLQEFPAGLGLPHLYGYPI